MNDTPIYVENLEKKYPENGSHALKGVSLEMKKGEILGLLGPNGAGKTTLISILTSIERSTAGSAYIFGTNVESNLTGDILKFKNDFGLVPQEIISHGFFSVLEVMNFVSGYHGIRKNKEHIEFLLRRLSLWEQRDKKVAQLSGGMKRRFLIAKALVHKPKLLLLDEPTAGVDIELRNNLWDFARELNAQGTSILLTTHYLEEAEQLCDRVAIINKGLIKKVGNTKELIKGLTQRRVLISLREPVELIANPYLIEQTDAQLILKVPSSMVLGDVIKTLRLDIQNVTDFKINEGTLQDAFLQVLGEG